MIRFDERKPPNLPQELVNEPIAPKRVAFALWTVSGVRIGAGSIKLTAFHCSHCETEFTIDILPIACPGCGCEFHEHREVSDANAR